MKYKNLGKTGLKISELGLGTAGYGGPENRGQTVNDEMAIKIIRCAIELGINFIDTANVYSMGRSEIVVGKAIEGMREKVVLATKVGDPTEASREGKEIADPNNQGLNRKHIMKSVNESLKRLGTDYIDLYQIHHPDPTTPLKETLTALSDLVRDGKIHYLGCSNFSAWQIEKALRVSEVNGLESFVSLQSPYNVIHRENERELLPLCVEEGLGFTPYSPLASGFLTGKYEAGKPFPKGSRGQKNPAWVNRQFTPRSQAILQEIKKLSIETGMTMSQLSLVWITANPAVTSPITGASNLEQLKENVDMVNCTLPSKTLKRISEVSKPDWLHK